ncbi:MAG TPA: efflux RND transporter permease subunit [Spirochaetia bacterium]|nr:efflux RND transporter permease subunit [Spirochaetia bacterium]
MIKKLIEKHNAIFAFAVLIVVMGVIAYARLPRESMPEIKQPYIFVTTTYVGVSAHDIESLVTDRIERELDGMDGVDEITSESRQNFSFIFVKFKSDVSVESALRRVKDRVDIARTKLPEAAEEPFVKEFSVSDWPFFVVVLSHPDGVQILRDSSKRFEDQISRLPGVLDVEVSGRPDEQVAVDIDPSRLDRYGFSVDDVIAAIQKENRSIPGGALENPERNYALAVTGEIDDPRAFENIYVTDHDVRVRLGDLGSARFTTTKSQTYSRLNGEPAITLSVKKRLGTNVIDLAGQIKREIDLLKGELPAGTQVLVTYDESRYIKDMIADLENNMFTGFLLVLLVTIFFLGGRNSLFISLAIPLSMLMSFFVLQMLGVTLNTIVLFSLILALGMLVDNGIVIVENIFRHGGMGKDRRQASIDGSSEVASPIISSTITTCLAFLPIIFMPGMMGDIMSYLPITVIIVLICSLCVALVINPVFCARFLKINATQVRKMNEGSAGFARVQRFYTRFVTQATRHPFATAGVVLTVAIGGFVAFGIFGKDVLFFPYLDPERVRVTVEAPAGLPLERTDKIVRNVEGIVANSPSSLASYATVSGRSGGTTASHRASVDVTYMPFNSRKVKGADAARELRKRLASVSGAIVKVEEGEEGPPTGDDISFEVRGHDYAQMGAIAEEIRQYLAGFGEFREVNTDFETSMPEYRVAVDRGRAAFYGISTAEIAGTVRTAINGSNVGTFRYQNDEYDIIVRYTEQTRDSLSALRNVKIVAGSGDRIALSSVADVKPGSSAGVIKRRNLERAVNVWANFDRNVANREEVTKKVNAQISSIRQNLPAGYEIGAGAGFDVRQESTDFLLQAFLVAVFLIFIVLIVQFNSIADPFIILSSVALSLGGVFWGFAVSGQNFVVIMSGIGCIALAGVVVNNCIVLVDYTHRLVRGGTPWRDAIVEAGRTRLRPVLLTALTTVLALVPMALGFSFDIHTFRFITTSESGEYWKAFSWTMLYGLTFATVMTLIVVPSLLTMKYRFLDRRRKEVQ